MANGVRWNGAASLLFSGGKKMLKCYLSPIQGCLQNNRILCLVIRHSKIRHTVKLGMDDTVHCTAIKNSSVIRHLVVESIGGVR